jgi:transcriptional regulator with XRE-family HTH domain
VVFDLAQMRGARGLLGWTQADLAEASGISLPTIKRMEAVGPGRSAGDTIATIQKAFEAAGVVFIPDNGARARISLRKG